MKKSNSSSELDFSKLPVPRARPPIRHVNVNEAGDSYLYRYSGNSKKRAMYTNKLQTEKFHDKSDNSIQYTDDEEDDSDWNTDRPLDASIDSLLSEPYSTPQNSPLGSQVHKRSFHSPNAYCPFNATNSSFPHKIQNQSADSSHKKPNLCVYIITFILFLMIAVIIQARLHEVVVEEAVPEREKDVINVNDVLEKSIQIIQTKFHNQRSNIWNDISAAIYDVALFPTKPSIIILFGNGTETLNCLAELLGQLSGKILGSNDYLTLRPQDFPNDVGETIHKLKVQILEKKSVVVLDLLGINTEALKAFHNFCDRESPLVKNSIYIITVTANGYKSSQRELDFVEKQIYKRLSRHIDKDTLDPLITRITDGIIVSVVPEPSTNFKYTDCSLFINNKL